LARAQRKLTVLASLDVAGYTRHMERDERGTLLALARIRMRILRPTLEEHGGSMFKTMGDGALIEFPNVEDSVLWAIAFQTAMAERNAGRRDDAIEVRLGIGLADVFVDGEDRFGAAVGFVVRLQQAAPAGGIAITHSVRWQLAKPLTQEFDRTEWVEFKNMEEQFEIWLWRGLGARGDEASDKVVGFGHRPMGLARQTGIVEAPSEAPPLVPAIPIGSGNGGRP
jgi:adenylate cyclase